jgi:O-glycosyl hydrolase
MIILPVVVLLHLSCAGSRNKPHDGEMEETITYDETMNIRYNETRQVIDGFGGSDAWASLPRDTAAANEIVKLLFSRTEGMGFTILRSRIPFRERLTGDDEPGLNDGFVVRKSDDTYDYTVDGAGIKTFNLNWNCWELSGTRDVIRRIKNLDDDGPEKLTIMSVPWTPPNNRVTRWKEDVTGLGDLNGAIDWKTPDWWGRLKKDKYNDYADLLADYVKNFEERMGAPLAILSVQNEPNWKVKYESCYWDGIDIRNFLRVIGQRFPRKGIALAAPNGVGIMAPEYENFNVNFDEMIKPSLDDPNTNNVLTHIALHQYNGAYDSSRQAGTFLIPGIAESGKKFWQTEVSGSGPMLPKGSGIENALYYARMIHFDMTLAQTNAFLYWWLWTNSSDADFSGSLIRAAGDSVNAATRLYVMGQYSRFIRPGWIRLDADASPCANVYSSAYRNPQTDEIAVVIINDSYSDAHIAITLHGAKFSSLDAWRTSSTEKLKSLGNHKLPEGNANVSLPSMSVTTFYGHILPD